MPPRRASARNASAAAASSSPSSSLFAGLTIAVAGKFSRPLAELKEIVTSNGGSAVATQTKACTHLLADALGSAKTDKAVAAGVAVVTEEWLVQSAKKGKLLTDPKLMISPPAAVEGDDEPAAAAAAAAATPKRKRGEDAEESADAAADADDADGDNSASAAAAAAPAAKKQKSAAAAAEPAAASASSAAAAAVAPAPTSFSGKKFLVMGGFSAGKFKVESAISTHGGELTTSVLKSLDFCVYGAPVPTDYGGVSGPGSKKYKEAKKLKRVAMLNEEEFFKLVAAMEAAKKTGGGGAGAAGAGAGSSSGGAGGDSEAHPIVAEFKEILALLGASDVKLEPASLSSITAAEDEMRMAIPPPLKALLLHVADGSQAIDSAKVGDLPYFWPSVADIREQFSYNSYLPIIYRDCKWMPYHMLDYDFCWNVIDIPTGSILQVDAECNSNRDLGYTFEGHISNFKRFLEERKEKEKNKPAAEAAAAAGAGADGEAASASSSSRGPSLADEFNASPLSGQSRGMGYTQAQKYYKAYKKAERSQ